MGRLRPATSADFAFLRALASRPENARFVVDEDDAALQGHVDAPDRDLVIWDHDGAAAGFALFCELDNPANRAELRRLALAQTGTGLGRVLLDDLKAYAFATLKVDRLWLDVAGDNLRAQKTYRRAGFVHEGTLRNHWKRPAGDIADLMIFAILRRDLAR